MVRAHRVLARLGQAYVSLCTVLAFFAVFTSDANYVAFYSLMALTLPLSVLALPVLYFASLIISGAGALGLLGQILLFVSLVGIAVAQWLVARAIMRYQKHRK